ncbi:MAG: phosphatase PAP2 family protein [Alphaproteobacteria bacterium]|nr:phosphatase PAP2 family protein [Alphaproteobacteria bacterium]
MIRHATLALLICLFGAPPAFAQKMNYLGQMIDLTELIPPPPPQDSAAWKQDLDEVLGMQDSRTEAQVQRAVADNILSIYRFEDVLGPKFKKENLPLMDALMEKAQADARAVLIAAKNAIQRPRPAAASKQVLALGGTPRLPTAYPSGGVVFTTVTAIVLSKMVPEKRFELSERNREYAVNRVVLGQHFPRDVRAGEIAGTVIAHALMQVPAFMIDLQSARADLRQALDYPPEPESVGSTKPK